ncbi:MAG TPA: 1-(5-phosphoribosyl)-5-[(5-phosphoribosylamino)methylideneamino]imidazole-4-carboxamide isomerase [Pirellulales bacterium]|jgi:phosphoribosylformimino-5-aminoimidazole carboxamide ribotide isomerase|nr:1-(5-phosphoribosyl)-5-[(5-phosphoribosylamino)methylideneamino]imidazole-4-carboxamide isomerase [Pirellulales bacterium]
MLIWPAIDLRGGKCVRLRQGDYDRETVFGDDPAAMARHWVDEGGQALHLVDLDGARSGQVENWKSIEQILSAVSVPCELGGGIRDEATIERLLELGLERLVLGTSAIARTDWFRQMCRHFPGRLVLGIDARDGFVATEGWRQTSRTSAVELARELDDEPLSAIIYTDIETDGMLGGPNLAALAQLAKSIRLPLVASGGITTAQDVAQLSSLGLSGCIIGRALYEGTLNLGEALTCA